MAIQLDPDPPVRRARCSRTSKQNSRFCPGRRGADARGDERAGKGGQGSSRRSGSRSDEPVTLNFPKPKPVKEIYDAIGKAYGFNVIFDPKLKDDAPGGARDVTAERALEIVMQAAGHFYKVLDRRHHHRC